MVERMVSFTHVLLMSMIPFHLSSLAKGVMASAALLAGAVGVATSTSPPEGVSAPLPVPYLSQAPDGAWVLPWSEACEEASVLMVDAFYHRRSFIDKDAARRTMRTMFAWEDASFQKNTDTNAEQTLALIRAHASFDAVIVRDPSADTIIKELNAGRPVMALVNMYTLYQEAPQGDSYHMVVLTGYDAKTQNLFLHDPARNGFKQVSLSRLLEALHDYNPDSHEADGPATILTTSS